MTQGIHPLAASMVNQLNRVDVISNNLANANTVGFKGGNIAEGSFNHYLQSTVEDDKIPDKESVVMNTIPKIDSSFVNEEVGSIVQTGNQLDFALKDRNMFFKIEGSNSNIELTRDGTFKVVDGYLVTQNGYKVLDIDNNPIEAQGDDFVSSIAVVKTKFSNLDRVGNNNFKAKNMDSVSSVVNNTDYMLQGAIEKSNVNTIKSMVDLIEAQRSFEQAQKAITGIDTINQKLIDTIGTNR